MTKEGTKLLLYWKNQYLELIYYHYISHDQLITCKFLFSVVLGRQEKPWMKKRVSQLSQGDCTIANWRKQATGRAIIWSACGRRESLAWIIRACQPAKDDLPCNFHKDSSG